VIVRFRRMGRNRNKLQKLTKESSQRSPKEKNPKLMEEIKD
jgi:hypothetical protein